ncbi:MAG: MlaD family protein [Bacteroidales bacterium]|nr:MlaD family protein [Bacteroidales bacterium]
MKKFFSKEVKIGVTVLVSLACLFWGIKYLKGVNLFTPVNFYYAHFEKVDGLTDSAPVTINGYQVGLVREIIYDYETGSLRVLMSLDKELKIPVNSEAVITSDMLGTAQIELCLAKNTEYYEVGADIAGKSAKGLMDNVANDLLPSVSNIMPKIDSVLTSLNKVVGNPALVKSIDRLDAITANLEQSSRQLAAVLGGKVPGIVSNVDSITSNINALTADLAEVSGSLKQMPIDSTMSNLNATTANLRLITDKVNGTDSSLGLLLNDRGLYNHIDHTVVSLDSLFMDIKKNPKRYVTIKVF